MTTESTDLKKTLSIRLLPDGFSFCSLPTQTEENTNFVSIQKEDISEKEYLPLFKETLFLNNIQEVEYTNIEVECIGTSFTIIPDGIAEEDYSYFLLLNSKERKDTIVLHEKLENKDMILLYALSEDLYYFILRIFPTAHIFHQVSRQYQQYLQVVYNSIDEKSVWIQCHKKRIDILRSEEKKIYANTFSYLHPNDAVYYILYIYQQFCIDQFKHPIYINGMPQYTNKIVEILRKYIAKIHYYSPENSNSPCE